MKYQFILLLIFCIVNNFDCDKLSKKIEKIQKEVERFERLKEAIKEAQLKVYDDRYYTERLKLNTEHNGYKFRKDTKGGFSNVIFRVKRSKRRDLSGRHTRTPVAIKIIQRPVFVPEGKILPNSKFVYQIAGSDDKARQMYKDFFHYVDALDQVINEYNVAKRLRHYKMYYYSNIHEMYRTKYFDSVYLVMDYMNGKDMSMYAYPEDRSKAVVLTQEEAVMNAARVGEMLWKLRQAGILYRDLKMQNLIMDSEHRVYLIDMGLALILNTTKNGYATDFCGTIYTMAPEALEQMPQGYQVDVWSFGIVIYMLLTIPEYEYGPFGDFEVEDTEEYIEKVLDTIRHHTPDFDFPVFRTSEGKLAEQLILGMLEEESEQRPTIEDVLKHEWFSSQGYYFDHLFNEGTPMGRVDKAKPPREAAKRMVDDSTPLPDAKDERRSAKIRDIGFSHTMWAARKDSTDRPAGLSEPTFISSNTTSSISSLPHGYEAISRLEQCIKKKEKLPDEFELLDPSTKVMERYVKILDASDVLAEVEHWTSRISSSSRRTSAEDRPHRSKRRFDDVEISPGNDSPRTQHNSKRRDVSQLPRVAPLQVRKRSSRLSPPKRPIEELDSRYKAKDNLKRKTEKL